MSVECFAQRLLNPFRGAMYTIKYGGAEAVTTDGLRWDIYVANDALLDNFFDTSRIQISDIRYGSWSAVRGLKRGPLYPSEDFRQMEEQGAVVYEHLLRIHRDIPFPFKDRFELWLLDTNGRPLALLHSAVAENDLALDLAPEWSTGFAARDRFVTPVAQELGLASRHLAASDYLARYINGRAGKEPCAQWFWRDKDGTGRGLEGIRLPPELEGRTVDREMFPALFLSEAGHDDAHRRLIEDFRDWQAVWLLVLPQITPALRRHLEQCVRRQSVLVESQYRLYPDIIDDSAIKAARVEAVLCRGEPGQIESEELAHSIDFGEDE